MLNIKHTLFPFQERDMNAVVAKLKEYRKVLFCANTGYGKTYSFCTVAKWFIHNYKKKAVILCHREELVNQSAETCIRMGMTVEKIMPKTKRLNHHADVYIAMEKTLDNRLAKNPKYLFNVGLVIIDETHSQLFNKHIEYFENQKILGFTATPIINERITYFKCDRCSSISNDPDFCCNSEMIEWAKPKTMSMFYDDIVVGASVDELIEFGQIVRDYNIVEKFGKIEDLKEDASGEFSKASQNKVFANPEAVFNVVKSYEQYCKGKKTLIFNSSTKVNKMVYDKFTESGYNCKMFDSVNGSELSRREIVEWFNNEDDAILINANVFTTGFDSREVQAIILNRATTSLSLFLQMVGRGARSSNKIYKDRFIVIDGGGNIDRHQRWSDPTRDWKKIFFNGIGKDRAKKEQPTKVTECIECGFLYERSESECPNCGFKPLPKPKKEGKQADSILVPIDEIPMPKGDKIAEYAIRRKENIHFAFKVMYEQILDLFILHGVTKEHFEKTKNNGNFDRRIGEIVRPIYFSLIRRKEFKDDTNRTLKYVINKAKEKVIKYYG